MSSKNSLAEDLRRFREKRLLTQKELAAELGVTSRSIQKWEGGLAMPGFKNRRRLRELLEEAA